MMTHAPSIAGAGRFFFCHLPGWFRCFFFRDFLGMRYSEQEAAGKGGGNKLATGFHLHSRFFLRLFAFALFYGSKAGLAYKRQ